LNRTTWIALLQLEQGRDKSDIDTDTLEELWDLNLINRDGDLTDEGWRVIHCLDNLRIPGI
jgi:hypothetical protein